MKTMIFVAMSILLFTAFSGCLAENPSEKEVEEISVRFPIPIVEAGQTPFYVALEKGFYEEEGLKVRFEHGSPELNPVKMVVTKADEFGIVGGPDTVLVARGANQPVKAVAVLHKNANFVVVTTLKESGLTSLEDLQGKKVGFFYGHISTDILRATFNKENIDIEEVNVGFNYSPLVAKQIDAEWAFRQTGPISLEAQDIPVNIIDLQDYGINSHGYTIFARDDFIETNPEIVEKFLRASLKGVQYTVHNPEEAIDILAKQDSKLDKDLELQRIPFYNDASSRSPYGYMDLEMFQETYDRLASEEVIVNEFLIEDVFDDSFVSAINLRD